MSVDTKDTGTLTRPEALSRLQAHFDRPYAQHQAGWDDLWKQKDFLPWDRGLSNPALAEALVEHKDVLGEPVVQHDGGSRRKRALVPGCGRGYDVLLLASAGYEAYGLEVSSNAVAACQEHARNDFAKYSESPPACGLGSYTFLCGDFFKSDWQQSSQTTEGFDFIFDYTFFCALPPEARPAWAASMRRLLRPSPDSRLLCVEFPLWKDPHSRGPPFGLSPETYIAHLTRPGDEVKYEEDGYPDPSANQPLHQGKGLVRLAHWQPTRTHEVGKGTDWVGVWGLDSSTVQ